MVTYIPASLVFIADMREPEDWRRTYLRLLSEEGYGMISWHYSYTQAVRRSIQQRSNFAPPSCVLDLDTRGSDLHEKRGLFQTQPSVP